VLPSCATSRGRSPIRHLGTRVAAVVPRQVSLSLTRADNHNPQPPKQGWVGKIRFSSFKRQYLENSRRYIQSYY